MFIKNGIFGSIQHKQSAAAVAVAVPRRTVEEAKLLKSELTTRLVGASAHARIESSIYSSIQMFILSKPQIDIRPACLPDFLDK